MTPRPDHQSWGRPSTTRLTRCLPKQMCAGRLHEALALDHPLALMSRAAVGEARLEREREGKHLQPEANPLIPNGVGWAHTNRVRPP